MNQIQLAVNILKKEEGFRPKAYYCTEHYPTIGYGFKCGEKLDPLPKDEMTEKEGLDKLKKLVISLDETMLKNPDLYRAYSPCNEARKAILLSMAYQIGIYGLLKFKKLLAALEQSDYKTASEQVLDSLAARQTPKRWQRNSDQIRTGEINAFYLPA